MSPPTAAAMGSAKQQQSPGPSFVPDPKKPPYLQHIETESHVGKEEFARIVDVESNRIAILASLENHRIMHEMRENGTIRVCPICLDEIPVIKSHEERNKGTNGLIMLCCGATHCRNCSDTSVDYMLGKSRNDLTNAYCFNCREPAHDRDYWANAIKPNDKRHWLLRAMASEYMDGIGGQKIDTKKAVKLFKRAADLGNTAAQDELAFYYYKGDSSTPKSHDKARYYAEKAAPQGAANSQYILAKLLLTADCEKHLNEGFQLITLAAFQGHQHARADLACYYEMMFQRMPSVIDEAWRKNLLRSLYWYGKYAEVEQKDSKGYKSLPNMVLHLDLAMRSLWHPRDDDDKRDPLPGYSHVPFCTWALAEGGQHAPLIFSKSPFDCWKHKCANCDKMSTEKQEFKACARCRAFHYCSKKCQVEHWKAGHKVDCKGHWIEEFFPDIRKAHE